MRVVQPRLARLGLARLWRVSQKRELRFDPVGRVPSGGCRMTRTVFSEGNVQTCLVGEDTCLSII